MLTPIVYSSAHKRNIPLLDLFQDISKLINTDTAKAKEYKKKLLGESVIVEAPDEYWDIGVAQSQQIPYDHWQKMDLHSKAKLKARFQLNNIADIINRHYELMAEARERAMKPKNG